MLSPQDKPAFIVTVDVEGDDLWSKPEHAGTENARFISRFNDLLEKHSLLGSYLVDHDMASDPVFAAFGKELVQGSRGEIGMHLHAWNTPPIEPLSDRDWVFQPYLIEYSTELMKQKVHTMTRLIEDRFSIRPRAHRAGRWALDERYAQILVEAGYSVDCSVTPHVSWSSSEGAPGGRGGADYRAFPSSAYYLNLTDISSASDAGLLELPVTVVPSVSQAVKLVHDRLEDAPSLMKRSVSKVLPRTYWLRPKPKNLDRMLWILDLCVQDGRSYAEMAIHSSELMPGGSPTFRTERAIEALYADLDVLFARARTDFTPMTLSQFADRFAEERK